jgi:hypothetical protein
MAIEYGGGIDCLACLTLASGNRKPEKASAYTDAIYESSHKVNFSRMLAQHRPMKEWWRFMCGCSMDSGFFRVTGTSDRHNAFTFNFFSPFQFIEFYRSVKCILL